MKRTIAPVVIVILTAVFTMTAAATLSKKGQQQKLAAAHAAQVERGRQLVAFGGCNHCHTPWKMGERGPEPDMSRMLSGHPANLKLADPPKMNGGWMWAAAGTNTAFAGPWGISYGRNLTPERVSGLGIWTEDMFIKTMRTGRHMGVSRPVLPPMPVENLNSLPDEDLKAIFAYLRTIKPIRNEVPDPVIAPAPVQTVSK